MKRITALILLISILLCGCSFFGSRIKEPVTFYYVQSEFQYGTANAVIVPEIREASGRTHDLPYLIRLYLMGPLEETSKVPLPRNVTLLSVGHAGDTVEITLSDTAQALTDAEYTLACACLALTCMDLTGAQEVRISSADRTVTMAQDDLMLADNSAQFEPVEETQ